MITKNFDVVLRIPEPSNVPMCFKAVQNDVDVYNLTVKVFDETAEIDYSQVSSATITFVKMDGHVVQGNMTVGENSLTYDMGTSEIACPGYVLASVQLIGSNNERLTTARFRFAVIPDLLSPSAIHSTTEFAELQRLKVELESIDIVALTAEVAAYTAEYATDFNNGTWTGELKIDGTMVTTVTGNYYKLKDRYIIQMPQINYTPAINTTPNTKISIGGFPMSFIDKSSYRISAWFGGVGIVIVDGLYEIANNEIVLYTSNPVTANYKPTITTGGSTLYGINIVR